MSASIPISSLHPFEAIPVGTTLKAEVSLLWPYSSSHASCALLLVDPDFRQRHARGEIRVRFKGVVAELLAKAHVGIGDKIKLELKGARWKESDGRALSITPGKPVEAELLFNHYLHLTVLEDASGALDGRVVHVDEPQVSDQAVPEPLNGPSTPDPRRSGYGTLGLGTPVVGGYASPAFMKRLRLSQEHFLTSPGLRKDDETVESIGSRKRRRVSGNGITKWTLLKEKPTEHGSESEHENEDPTDLGMTDGHDTAESAGHARPGGLIVEDMGSNVDTSSACGTRETSMAPPPLPRLRMPQPFLIDRTRSRQNDPLTPKLFPVSPSSLPIPSPFPQTPLTLVEITNEVITSNTDSIPTDSAPIPESAAHPGYFDLKMSSDSTKTSMEASFTETDQISPTVPLKDIIDQPDLAVSIADAINSPSSGSEADISSNDGLTSQANPLVERKTSPDEREYDLNELNDPRDRPISSQISSPSDIDSATAVAEAPDSDQSEAEDARMSGRSTPSDDQNDSPASALPRDRLLVFDARSSQLSSSYASPSLPPQSTLGAVVKEIMPSKLPVLNDHHPFGLDDSKPSEDASVHLGQLIKSGGTRGNGSDGHSSQDEDAAWTAMDSAIHDLNANSHERQQAPGPPLASIRGPEHSSLGESEAINRASMSRKHPNVEIDGMPEVNEVHRLSSHLSSLQKAGTLEDEAHGLTKALEARAPTSTQITKQLLTDDLMNNHEPSVALTENPQDRAEKDHVMVDEQKADSARDTGGDVPKLPDDVIRDKQTSHAVDLTSTVDASVREQHMAPTNERLLRPCDKHKQKQQMSTSIDEARRRPSSRLSLVPDSLDTWFTAKSPTSPDTNNTSRRKTIHTLPSQTAPDAPILPLHDNEAAHRSLSPPASLQPQPSTGTTTDLTYLTPLTNLSHHLNSPTAKVDVLAVVTDAASIPARAKSGPRDWFTVMHVSSPALDDAQVRVEVFRPWKESLPVATEGDVVLLRNFGVRSRERKAFLLSGEESGWCVWRWQGDEEEGVEEVRGPPVEVGEGERKEVQEVRGWWEERRDVQMEEEMWERRRRGKGRTTL
ncbi:hypothetical protein K461DRAFT_267963 [Myriangium duriaei CBS 260.36]|uniref:Telomeric single stranded DNA binding POT1/Cdc13 domain-containing protein n=1 Tax=Myriangium duriaei CBS 260.36 TaxID=1168546 RepID=A0A9P4J0T1_9PEZI|nr:hypothetical protein K461DRAFT_267963 [Myriangium duriaei CBS 260.36]